MVGVGEWWDLAPIGWVIGLCMWFGVFSPIMTLLTARHIYLYPCQMAKRVRGGWVATRDARAKLEQKTVYEIDKFRGDNGVLVKRFVPSGRTT